ncbi:MAG TPA: helix-turn-helix domain-containing protein [Baekduia sp.]
MATDFTRPGVARDEALAAIGERIEARAGVLSEAIVRRIQAEILDYRVVDVTDPVLDEALEFTRTNLEWFVDVLHSDGTVSSESELERVHLLAARRVHEGVSLESLQRALRIWGEVTWEAVLSSTRPDEPEEREVALELAGRIWRHVDRLSDAAAAAFVDEIADRGLLRHEAMEGLLAGHGNAEWMRRLAKSAHVVLRENYVVIIIRAAQLPHGEIRQYPLAARAELDQIVAVARSRLRPAAGLPLIGLRQGDLVALYPVSVPDDLHAVAADCRAVAAALAGSDVSIGMSGWAAGLQAITDSYGRAREAAEIGAVIGISDRALELEDVLVDHLVLSSDHAQQILSDILRPLVEYDRDRHAELVPTLKAYLDTGANLAHSAKDLMVHANTVAYRLRRIAELSGRDPRRLGDLLVLSLALKQAEHTARGQPSVQGPADAVRVARSPGSGRPRGW